MNNFNWINKATVQTLKQLFGKRIKQNFLIQMLEDVKKRPDFIFVLKHFSIGVDYVSMVSGNTEAVEFEICKNIIGIHRSNLIFLSDDERVFLESNSKYREQLVDEVISQLKLREYAGKHFRKFPLIAGDEFIFYPLPYYEFTICCYAGVLLHSPEYKSDCFSLYALIFNKSLSALSLLGDNFLNDAYPLCRITIELFLKLICFRENKNLLKEDEKFEDFVIDRECGANSKKEEFEKFFENRKDKKCHNRINYLHYGWVDKIDNYHEIVKSNSYSFNALLDYVTKTSKLKQLESLKWLYKKCNAFTHGNVISSKYKLLYYFEISLILGLIIQLTFKFFIKDTSANPVIEEINILEKLEKALNKVENQYNKKSTRNFEDYYKSILNQS